ncbi:MAG: GNAT family N-acetyltransferase [Clostridia bacterium]|nr:GNAT family N-acetyltransferase [Clostridia bacterium]
MENFQIKSVREYPDDWQAFSEYIASKWADESGKRLYDDCIFHGKNALFCLPEWWVAYDNDVPVGCAGLITNDFISRMDLMPWLCALYVNENMRGRGIAGKLIARVKEYARTNGFSCIYLATDHVSFYERYGAVYIGEGVHPWGETSRIYKMETDK